MPKMTHLEKSIKTLKNKGFTHLKIELEASLGRSYYDDDEECGYCDGRGYQYCDYCDDGSNQCQTCEGSGELVHAMTDGTSRYTSCNDCNGDGYINCTECDGDGQRDCSNCDSRGYVGGDGNNMTDSYCEEVIRQTISQRANDALVFSRFYNDGSVDSEYTFTIPVEYADVLPEIVQAFADLSKETGTLRTDNAGMHMSVMNGGDYGNLKPLSEAKLRNFSKQMRKLLPALYFLASPNHKARALNYRHPGIGASKYNGVNLFRGGIEFRVFETCYARPEAILENIQVIAKCIQFYSNRKGCGRSAFKRFSFSEDGNQTLHRWFTDPEALAVLDKTVEHIKPDGKTIATLKRERQLHKIKQSAEGKRMAKARLEYAEVVASNERGIREQLRLDMRQKASEFSCKAELKAFITRRRKQLRSEYIQPFDTWLSRNHSYNRGEVITI